MLQVTTEQLLSRIGAFVLETEALQQHLEAARQKIEKLEKELGRESEGSKTDIAKEGNGADNHSPIKEISAGVSAASDNPPGA